MAKNGNGNTGNTGTATSASQAQSQAAAGNAAASNAANAPSGESAAKGQAAAGNAAASNAANAPSGESAAKGEASKGNAAASNNATNAAGLMGSLIGFGNAVAKAAAGNGGGGGSSDSKSDAISKGALLNDKIAHSIQNIFTSAEKARSILPSYIVDEGDKAYTDARKNGKTEAEAQYEARQAVRKGLFPNTPAPGMPLPSTIFFGGYRNAGAAAFEGKNTGPTYDPSVTARAHAKKSDYKNAKVYAITHRGSLTYDNNKTPGEMQKELASRPLAYNKESFKNGTLSKNNTTTPAATTNSFTPAPTTAPAANNTPGGNLGGETGGIVSGAAPTNTSDATNTGFTYRGDTVSTPSGTSVTDSGTGGSISSSISTPSRDASSVGLGVYNTDRANYDQDNWNRGMEVESSSLVSDEECKAFAKRAFMENSEPFKKVRITIIKNVR